MSLLEASLIPADDVQERIPDANRVQIVGNPTSAVQCGSGVIQAFHYVPQADVGRGLRMRAGQGLLRKVVTVDFTATLISQPRLEDRGVLRRQRGSQNKGAQV